MKKEREADKDTVVAYHARVQHQIKDELNGLDLGPGTFPMFLAKIIFGSGVILGVIGVLVITLRHRHVYLISWNDQFLGPAFIVAFILCTGLATYMVILANRRANEYRRGLVFRPIGDYGVAVTHKSRMNYEHETKEQLKSGTTPHSTSAKPLATYTATRDRYGRPVNGIDNRGYKIDPRGPPPRYEERRDQGRSMGDRPRPPPGDRYRDDDRPRRGPPGDRYGDDRDRRGPPRGPPRDRPPGPRGPPRDPRDPDRRGPPRDPRDPDRRGPPRDPRDPDRRGPPRGPPRDDDRRRQDDRRRFEEERRRRAKEAEANDPLLEKPPLPMAGPRPPVDPTETLVFRDNADVSSESIL